MLENNLDKSVGFSIKLRTIVYTTALLGGIWAFYTLSAFFLLHDINLSVKERASIVKIVEVPKEIKVEVPTDQIVFKEVIKEVPKVVIKEVKVPAPVEQKTQLKLDYNLTQPAPQPAPPVVEAPKPAPAPQPQVEAPKPKTEYIAELQSNSGGMCSYKVKETGIQFKYNNAQCYSTGIYNAVTGEFRGETK